MHNIKTFVLLVSLFAVNYLHAQFFNNVNNELCIKLYEKSDPVGKYIVYMVMENLEAKDGKILEQWNSLDQFTKSMVTQQWTLEGKRVEVLRSPYVMYPPVFPHELKKPVLYPLPPAKPAKDFWKNRFHVVGLTSLRISALYSWCS